MATPFIRTQMLPPQTPPVTERGVVKWMRENLFSSPANIILTLAAVFVLWQFVALALPWLIHGVWTADSLGQCRDVIAANFGPDAAGACWAVIRARWNQFIFGFYPTELWWRPILTFALTIVALTPLLYSDDKRNATRLVAWTAGLLVLALIGVGAGVVHTVLSAAVMAAAIYVAATRTTRLLAFTLVYPFLAVWMLWGGSFWNVAVVLMGFGLLVGLYGPLKKIFTTMAGSLGVTLAAGASVIAALVWWTALDGYAAQALDSVLPFTIEAVESDKFGGFLLAFVIGFASISISLPIGILLALGRQSNMLLIKTLSVGFIEFVRGVPLITMLFTASLLLQYFLPPQVQFDLILRVVILVTLFSAAYNAEVIRGGLAALPKGQYEAADALGLDYWQAQRLIIMPQALKISIPGIVNTFIGLFKDTTLVSFVGLMDPLRGVTAIVRADINWKGIYWEPYIFVGAIFFLACYGMSRYSLYLEARLKTDHR
jgi:general L-amino acid transport system permease protein